MALNRQLLYVGVMAALALVSGFVMAKGYLPLMPILPKPGRTPGVGVEISEYDAQGLVLVAMALLLIFVLLLIPRMARGSDPSFLLKLLLIGFAAKMVAALVRLWANYDIYGFRDVARYSGQAKYIASHIHQLDFASVAPYLDFGTNFTMFYTGVLYSITGPTLYGGFLVFGAIAFIGSYFYFRAFITAFPDSDYRLFGILVFLVPSILYWPNGIGKDALIFLFVGLAAYGGALLVVRWRLVGLVPLVPGLAGVLTIREPVAWMIVIGLVGAFLLGRGRSNSHVTKAYRAILLAVGIGMIWVFLPSMLEEVGLEEASFGASAVDSVDSYFARRQRSTGRGGSGFDSRSLADPGFLPAALATALFRPFPWEAHNLQSAIQALDGALLLGLMVWRSPNIIRAMSSFRSSPYVIFVVAYAFIMILALMTIANFGTLARERAMLLPFLLMLIAFEPAKKPSPAPAPQGRVGSAQLPGAVAAAT